MITCYVSITARSYNCLEDLLDKYECSRKFKGDAMAFITQLSGDYMNTICGEYSPDSDACEKRKPLRFKNSDNKFNGTTNSIRSRVKSLQFKTPMFVLIDLLDSFADPDTILIG